MSISFTNINPADGAQVGRTGTLVFTLTTDLRDGAVRIGVYAIANDTEEVAWNGTAFVGRYVGSVKSGNDFILRRRGGWPTGGISLRVSEVGSTEVMSIWTDGSGAPNNAVGEDGDYYLDTATGAVYKKASGTYSSIYTPTNPTTAAPSVGIGAGNSEGVAATFARSDHNHTIRTGSTDLTIGTLTDGDLIRRSGTTLATLTADQVAVLLPAFTGDSGSGGVKGLVPAPSAGDAAALKFLAAGGTWAVPASGGATEYWAVVTSSRSTPSGGGSIFQSANDALTLPAGLYLWEMVASIGMNSGASRTITVNPNFSGTSFVAGSSFGPSDVVSPPRAGYGDFIFTNTASLSVRHVLLKGVVSRNASFTITPQCTTSGAEVMTVNAGTYFYARLLSSTFNQNTNGSGWS